MRALTTAFRSAIAGATVRVGLLCLIDYPSTPLRVWTGQGDLAWDGHTWKGLGNLGSVSAIQERFGAQAGNITLTLAGVAPELRALALADASAGRSVRLWLAAFDAAWAVIPDPWEPFAGTTDVHRILDGTIEVNVETWLARLRLSRVSRYTHEDQQRHFPGDRGLEHGATVGNKPFYWGTAAPATATAGNGNAGGGGGDARSDLE
jgi:hypothetical protein